MSIKSFFIMLLIVISCAIVGIIDAIIMPAYIIKSLVKLILFLVIPLIYLGNFDEDNFHTIFYLKKDSLLYSLKCGIFIYGIVLLAFCVANNFFDFTNIIHSLEENGGIDSSNFIFVSTYIALINSFCEELFFRGFAFLSLKKYVSRITAYIFSATVFALYHVAIIFSWGSFLLICLMVSGLFLGGLIFNYLSEKFNNIYVSWFIHMFANLAINLIGFRLLGIF